MNFQSQAIRRKAMSEETHILSPLSSLGLSEVETGSEELRLR